MKLIFVATMCGLFLLEDSALAMNKTISDSLVNNLRCNTLSLGSMLGSIRPDAFSARNHIPIGNWGFRSGAFELGACWGMGSTQRKFFYLLRLGEKSAVTFDKTAALDMIRGATLKVERDPSEANQRRIAETKLRTYKVIPIPEENIASEFGSGRPTGFLDILLRGITYDINGFAMTRLLRSEVERSQERHFFRLENVDMGAGSGPQEPVKNFETLRTLKANLRLNRLTLLNLRVTATKQHIVIAKSFSADREGNVTIMVYDSNRPEEDKPVYFKKKSGHFYAPKIMGRAYEWQKDTDYITPLGVFIVDEEERADIEASLLNYYQGLCK